MYKETRKKGRGFSLVEALVALVVLSVGMLGIAGLYIASLKTNRSALVRTQALTLAADIADRIRANRAATASYASTTATAPASAVAACETSAGCTAANMATNDLYRWSQAIPPALPGATYRITVVNPTPTTAAVVTVQLTWEDTDGATTYSMSFQV